MYLTQAYLESVFTADQVAALCPLSADVTTTIELAEAATEAALGVAGYTAAIPASTYSAIDDVPKQIKLAAVGAWLELAYGRNVKEIPEALKFYPGYLGKLESGSLQVEGVAKTGAAQVGGTTATDTAGEVADGARPAIFDRQTLRGM